MNKHARPIFSTVADPVPGISQLGKDSIIKVPPQFGTAENIPESVETLNQTNSGVFVRRPSVEAQTGLSCSSIYQMMHDGTFPKNIKIGVRAVGWLQTELDEWIAQRVEASRCSTK